MKHYKANYHTHCDLCRHATGTIEDYVIEAIKQGYQAIGISDHAPLDFLEERSVRMSVEEYPEYIKQLKKAIVDYLEYILIYRSLEIEYFDHLHQHYQSLLEHLDYLILGQHYVELNQKLISIYKVKSLEEIIQYKNTVIKAMRSGYFKILAHPDIFMFNQGTFTEPLKQISQEIIHAAIETNTLLEMNANGFRKKKHLIDGVSFYRYPREEFWKMVSEMKAKVIISSDAHHPNHLSDEAMTQAYEMARHLSLEVEEELVLD